MYSHVHLVIFDSFLLVTSHFFKFLGSQKDPTLKLEYIFLYKNNYPFKDLEEFLNSMLALSESIAYILKNYQVVMRVSQNRWLH